MTRLGLRAPLLPALFLALTATAACAADWNVRGKIAQATTYATDRPSTRHRRGRLPPRTQRPARPPVPRPAACTHRRPPPGLVRHRPRHQRLGTRPHTPGPPRGTIGLVPVQGRPQLPQRPRHRFHHPHAARKLDMVRPPRRSRPRRLRHPLQPRRLQVRHRPGLRPGDRSIGHGARNSRKHSAVIASRYPEFDGRFRRECQRSGATADSCG